MIPRLHFESTSALCSMPSLSKVATNRTFLPSNRWASPTILHTVVVMGLGKAVCFDCATSEDVLQKIPAKPTSALTVHRHIIGNPRHGESQTTCTLGLRLRQALPLHWAPSRGRKCPETSSRVADTSESEALMKLLFAVGDPDVFDLGGVLEEEAVGGGGGVEPVDGAAFVGEDLF